MLGYVEVCFFSIAVTSIGYSFSLGICTIWKMWRIARFFTAVFNFTKCEHILFILSLYGIDLRRHENNSNRKLSSLVYKCYSTYFVRAILLFYILWTISLEILDTVLCKNQAVVTYFEEC